MPNETKATELTGGWYEDCKHPRGQDHLSWLVEDAARGQPFVIARAGKPLVKVTRLEAETPRRLGFLQGQASVPEDFDSMGADPIRALFEGGEPS